MGSQAGEPHGGAPERARSSSIAARPAPEPGPAARATLPRVSDPGERPPAPRTPPLAEPAAGMPRWLAWIVLLALLASGGWVTWQVLASPPAATVAPAAETR